MNCPICGFTKFNGFGHPYGGKRTPPKTLWCTGKKNGLTVNCPKCNQPVPKVYYNGAYRIENHNTVDDSDICHGSGTLLSKQEAGYSLEYGKTH